MSLSGTLVERRPAAVTLGAASRQVRGRRRARARAVATPYLLLVPALLVYCLFTVYPVFRQFEISFFNWHIFPGASNPFVGWSNYTKIFHDPIVETAARNVLLYVVLTVPAQMAIGLFAAAVLTDRLPGSTFWRAAVYIPVVTSYVVVSWVFSYIFSSQGGIGNAVVSFFAGHTVNIAWTAQTWTAMGVIWMLTVWKGVGWSFIIFLAALDSVPRDLMESARMDGASEPRVWRHVVIPSMRAAITFVLVLLVIGAMQAFTQFWEITKGLGGPYNSTQNFMTYMYQQAFSFFNFGYAAALASLLALVLFGFSWAEIRVLRQQEV
ncbi:MAG TPA: sugar ABC transporter permease [Acidimicrobiales bacterium]|nr:sugar ABC transporter permease [Acidimicrobiales bacterium]